VADDRHSHAEDAQLLSDPDQIARREAENGLRQFDLALEMIPAFVKDKERPFKLRAGLILPLHKAALEGLHRLAGTFRNTPVKIGGSRHQPPHESLVADEIQMRVRERKLGYEHGGSFGGLCALENELDSSVC